MPDTVNIKVNPVFFSYMGTDYITVSLPAALIAKIDSVIEELVLGYKSRPEFIKDAVRRLLERYEPLLTDKTEKETQ